MPLTEFLKNSGNKAAPSPDISDKRKWAMAGFCFSGELRSDAQVKTLFVERPSGRTCGLCLRIPCRSACIQFKGAIG